jgi:hypothetical protein
MAFQLPEARRFGEQKKSIGQRFIFSGSVPASGAADDALVVGLRVRAN